MQKNFIKQLIRKWYVSPVLLVVLGILGSLAFVPRQASPIPVIRVGGALDLKPLADAVAKEYNRTSPVSMVFIPSTDTLGDLKAGRIDAALLGRDIGNGELVSAEDHVVAYDAVCILINQRSYTGGGQYGFIVIGSAGIASRNQPAARYGGLKNLSMDDLRGMMGNVFGFSNNTWKFSGPQSGYFTFQPDLDDAGQPVPDPDKPNTFRGAWVWNEVQLIGEALQPGVFDTQAALMQKLVIPESALSTSKIGFIDKAYDSEELLISRSFSVNLNPDVSSQAFTFFLEFASRRVTVSALRHKFALSALSIDDVDPLSDPSVIYNGSYPLSRRIHLLLRAPVSRQVRSLARFMESDQGQQLISDADYLPVNQRP